MIKLKSSKQLNERTVILKHLQDVTDDLFDLASVAAPFKQSIVTLRVISGRTFTLTSSTFTPRGIFVVGTDNRTVTSISTNQKQGNKLDVTVEYTGATNANLTMLLIGNA